MQTFLMNRPQLAQLAQLRQEGDQMWVIQKRMKELEDGLLAWCYQPRLPPPASYGKALLSAYFPLRMYPVGVEEDLDYQFTLHSDCGTWEIEHYPLMALTTAPACPAGTSMEDVQALKELIRTIRDYPAERRQMCLDGVLLVDDVVQTFGYF